MNAAGIVVIGRNEGERLRRCLDSVLGRGSVVVYVDSGSTDGSAGMARTMGCEVLELDPARPFSAARARNEGFEKLVAARPGIEFVQFLDGDSELRDGWLEKAAGAASADAGLCAVIGRLRELHPEASVYNRICELEWRLPVGEVTYFGGIALMRAKAFREAGGFNAGLVAGEEPELAQRMRRSGWRIACLDEEMAVHDAAITRFGQWWKRSVRSGHAYAQVAWMGTGLRGRFGLRASMRIWFWAVVLPAAAGILLRFRPWWALAIPALYLLQMAKIAAGRRRQGASPGLACVYALLWLPGQIAQALGQCRFLARGVFRRPPKLIEYKSPERPPDSGGA